MRVFQAVFDPNAEPSLPEAWVSQEAGPAARSPEAPDTSSEDAAEIAFWQSVQVSDDDAEYTIYLEGIRTARLRNSLARAWKEPRTSRSREWNWRFGKPCVSLEQILR